MSTSKLNQSGIKVSFKRSFRGLSHFIANTPKQDLLLKVFWIVKQGGFIPLREREFILCVSSLDIEVTSTKLPMINANFSE